MCASNDINNRVKARSCQNTFKLKIQIYKYLCMNFMLYQLLSHVQLFATPWTVAHQAPLSRGFSRQEYWNGLPFPSPGGLSNPGMKSQSPALQAVSLLSEPPEKPKPKRHTIEWETKFTNISDTGLTSRIYTELVKLNISKDLIQNEQTTQTFLKRICASNQ